MSEMQGADTRGAGQLSGKGVFDLQGDNNRRKLGNIYALVLLVLD